MGGIREEGSIWYCQSQYVKVCPWLPACRIILMIFTVVLLKLHVKSNLGKPHLFPNKVLKLKRKMDKNVTITMVKFYPIRRFSS